MANMLREWLQIVSDAPMLVLLVGTALLAGLAAILCYCSNCNEPEEMQVEEEPQDNETLQRLISKYWDPSTTSLDYEEKRVTLVRDKLKKSDLVPDYAGTIKPKSSGKVKTGFKPVLDNLTSSLHQMSENLKKWIGSHDEKKSSGHEQVHRLPRIVDVRYDAAADANKSHEGHLYRPVVDQRKNWFGSEETTSDEKDKTKTVLSEEQIKPIEPRSSFRHIVTAKELRSDSGNEEQTIHTDKWRVVERKSGSSTVEVNHP